MNRDDVFSFDVHKVEEVHLPSYGTDFIDWGLHTIMATSAWQKTKGEGVRVVVLDTGVDYSHPDLKNNIAMHRDFCNSSTGSMDIQGHGTHVAGMIAGRDNGIGIVGVSPAVQLYTGKVLDDNGKGSFDSIIKGIEWAIELKADVINMSLGTTTDPPQKLYDVIKKAYDAGIIIVAATGNENNKVSYPAQYDEVIAVGAINNKYEKAEFSNYGIKNEITAPGVDILSCYKNKGYAKLSGTSMATPIITGSIALYLSYVKRSMTTPVNLEVVLNALLKATVDLGKEGKDEYFGAGLINLAKLI